MITTTQEKIWTYEDYLKLSDDIRYEILEGRLIMVPAPSLYHQESSRDLGFLIWNYVKQKNWGVVYYAPVDVILDKDKILQPDIVFVSKENSSILQQKGIFGSPDLVIEILSPSTVYRDRYEKKQIYEQYKVKEYWIVDTANKTIEVFTLENDKYNLFCFAGEEEKAKSKVIDGFEMDVKDIF